MFVLGRLLVGAKVARINRKGCDCLWKAILPVFSSRELAESCVTSASVPESDAGWAVPQTGLEVWSVLFTIVRAAFFRFG